MFQPPPSRFDTFLIRVELRGVEPGVWRTLSVPADIPLSWLHEILQVAFGWTNSHLHDFLVNKIRFGMSDVEDEIFVVDEESAPLGAVAHLGSKFLYRYDFGDDWEHDVHVETVVASADPGFVCVAGARACPPEDCGGPPGYAQLLKALANPRDPQHQELREWVGRRFDPDKFETTSVNKKLKTLYKRATRGRGPE